MTKPRIRLNQSAQRRCLGLDCGKLFNSTDPGNRKFPACRQRESTVMFSRFLDAPVHVLGAGDRRAEY
jgi:hypothetical protein